MVNEGVISVTGLINKDLFPCSFLTQFYQMDMAPTRRWLRLPGYQPSTSSVIYSGKSGWVFPSEFQAFVSPFLFRYTHQIPVFPSCSCLTTGSGIQTCGLQELCQGPEGEEGVCSRQRQRAQRKLLAVAPHIIFWQGVSETETHLPFGWGMINDKNLVV